MLIKLKSKLMNINALDWLKNQLPKVNDEPILLLEEIDEHDDGFEDAQKITKERLYEKESTEGEYNEDDDEIEKNEVEVAKPLFVIRKTVPGAHPLKLIFLFSSTNEDTTEEKFYELAKRELKPEDQIMFSKLFPNY